MSFGSVRWKERGLITSFLWRVNRGPRAGSSKKRSLRKTYSFMQMTLWRSVMEPIIYWPSVFNKEDIKHAFILSSKRKPGHEQRLSLFPGFPGYSHDTFRTFLNTLVPRVFFSYTNFRHWSIGYQLRGGITHKHSDVTRVVTAMDSWSHWHCLICFRLGLCHADSLFQVLRYWGMTRKCNEHAKM